jgi:hypothetical protein
MKVKATLLAFLPIVLMAQVTINKTVFIAENGVFYTNAGLDVEANGILQTEGTMVIEGDVNGDHLMQLEPTANLELYNGTLRLENETDENFTNLVLGQNGFLEIPVGNTLTLSGDLNNQNTGAGIRLLADATGYAQLLTTNSILTDKGTIYAEQYLSAANNIGWRQFGSPVAATFAELDDDFQTFYESGSGTIGTSSQWNAFYWESVSSGSGSNPPANGWQNVPNNAFAIGPANQAVGFTYYAGGLFDILNNGLLDVEGEPGNGNYAFNTYPTSTAAVQSPETVGWQLVPNPYTSNIDINALLSDNTNFPLAYKAIHIWDAKNQQYVAITDDVNIDLGFNGTSSSTTAVNIAPFQAFWVKGGAAGVETITLTNTHRTVVDQGNFFKTMPDLIRINAVASDSSIDQTIITFEELESDGLTDHDAFKIMSLNHEKHNLYTIESGNKLSVNRKAMPIPEKSIPMQFEAPNANEYTIDMTEASINPFWTVALEDHKTRIVHDMRSEPYVFKNDPNFMSNRFTVHINKKDVPFSNFGSEKIKVFGYDKTIKVTFDDYIQDSQAEVIISNLAGQILFHGRTYTNEAFEWPADEFTSVYVVHVKTASETKRIKIVQ